MEAAKSYNRASDNAEHLQRGLWCKLLIGGLISDVRKVICCNEPPTQDRSRDSSREEMSRQVASHATGAPAKKTGGRLPLRTANSRKEGLG